MNGQRVSAPKPVRRYAHRGVPLLSTALWVGTTVLAASGCGDNQQPPMNTDGGMGEPDGGSIDAPVTDFEPPGVQIVFPPPRSVTDADAITLRGKAGDASGVASIMVNGVAATSEDGFATWRAEIPLEMGTNDIVILAEDTRGNAADSDTLASVTRTDDVRPNASVVVWDQVAERIVLLDTDDRTIYALDPTSKRRTLLSDGSVGQPLLEQPSDATWDPQNNRILVTDAAADALFAVDPQTGARSVISDADDSGPPLVAPTSVSWDTQNNRALVIADSGPQRLISVAANGARSELASLDGVVSATAVTWDETANRALVLDAFDEKLYAVGGDGSLSVVSDADDGGDNAFLLPIDITWDPVGNRAMVADFERQAIVAVDVSTGARTLVTNTIAEDRVTPLSPVDLTWDRTNGRLLVADRDLGAVLSVSVATGGAEMLSDAYVGLGPALRQATGLAWDPDNHRALVVDAELRGVLSVALDSGDRTVLTSPFRGGGEALVEPADVTWDTKNHRPLVLDVAPGALFAIAPETGQRTLLSLTTDGNLPDMRVPRSIAWDSYNERVILANEQELLAIEVATGTRSFVSRSNVVGQGPSFTTPRAVAVWTSEPGNDFFFVADSGLDALLFVDVDVDSQTSGDRTLLSHGGNGAGTEFDRPIDVVWDDYRQQALVIDGGLGALLGVDPSTGDRELLSSAERGRGPQFVTPHAIAWDPVDHHVLVLDTSLLAVLAIDPETGDRVILTR